MTYLIRHLRARVTSVTAKSTSQPSFKPPFVSTSHNTTNDQHQRHHDQQKTSYGKQTICPGFIITKVLVSFWLISTISKERTYWSQFCWFRCCNVCFKRRRHFGFYSIQSRTLIISCIGFLKSRGKNFFARGEIVGIKNLWIYEDVWLSYQMSLPVSRSRELVRSGFVLGILKHR